MLCTKQGLVWGAVYVETQWIIYRISSSERIKLNHKCAIHTYVYTCMESVSVCVCVCVCVHVCAQLRNIRFISLFDGGGGGGSVVGEAVGVGLEYRST